MMHVDRLPGELSEHYKVRRVAQLCWCAVWVESLLFAACVRSALNGFWLRHCRKRWIACAQIKLMTGIRRDEGSVEESMRHVHLRKGRAVDMMLHAVLCK